MAKTTSPQQGLQQLEAVLEEYLVKKAPVLPANIKDLIVQFAPWLTLLGVILGLPAVLTLFGLGSFLSIIPFGYGMGMGTWGSRYMMAMVFMVITLVLQAMALPGLFNRTRQGWQMLFYALIVNAVYAIITVNLGSLIIGSLLGLYLLFQVKTYYK